MSTNNNSQSEAVWISGKPRTHSFDLGASSGAGAAGSSPFQSRFGFARSWSVNSEGASTTTSTTSGSSGYESTSSPPRSPIDRGNSGKYSNNSNSKAMNIPGSDPMAAPGGGRFRTSSFSSGYGASFDHDSDQKSSKSGGGGGGGFFSEPDPYLIHSPLSSSAPQGNLFRRSNSISVGTVDYGSPNGKYQLGGSPRNLGPIDELGKVHHFGDAFKKSVSALFNAPKMPPQMQRQRSLGSSNVPEQRKKTQMTTDRVVSLLCENAIR